MVVLQTLILIRGTKTTFRWQNGAFIIAMIGTLIAFVVLLVGSRHGFLTHLNAVNAQVRRRDLGADHRQGQRRAARTPTWAT